MFSLSECIITCSNSNEECVTYRLSTPWRCEGRVRRARIIGGGIVQRQQRAKVRHAAHQPHQIVICGLMQAWRFLFLLLRDVGVTTCKQNTTQYGVQQLYYTIHLFCVSFIRTCLPTFPFKCLFVIIPLFNVTAYTCSISRLLLCHEAGQLLSAR